MIPATSQNNVLIAIPAYRGLIHQNHFLSMLYLSHTLRNEAVLHDFKIIGNESLITRGRNKLVNYCLQERSGALPFSHLLFSDSDVGFDPKNVLEMLYADKDIIGLPYSRKSINWEFVSDAAKKGHDPQQLPFIAGSPVVNDFSYGQRDISKPLRMDQIGTGTMLIKRGVFEKFKESFPERRYALYDCEALEAGEEFGFEFFRAGISQETDHYESEDYMFCLEAKKLGLEVYLLPWAKTTHTGQFDYACDLSAQAQLGIASLPQRLCSLEVL